MLVTKSFCAKILLFGEYSVIRNSMALAIPYDLFDGKLTFPSEQNHPVDNELKAFSSYIKNLKDKKELFFDFDSSSFSFDVSGGLIFSSTIPQGYGVGSSGALVAAIFDRYAKISEEKRKDIPYLKRCLGLLESHFHGSSSGVDPLISYLNSPILLDGKGGLERVIIPKVYDGNGKGAIFLLNTGRTRRTEPLVNLFLEKCSSKDFAYLCDRVLSPISNACIDNFLEGDIEKLLVGYQDLSRFQYEHFGPMIPGLYKELWEEGITNESFTLKLCGAGGGGFLLGIAKDFESLPKEILSQEVRPLFRF